MTPARRAEPGDYSSEGYCQCHCHDGRRVTRKAFPSAICHAEAMHGTRGVGGPRRCGITWWAGTPGQVLPPLWPPQPEVRDFTWLQLSAKEEETTQPPQWHGGQRVPIAWGLQICPRLTIGVSRRCPGFSICTTGGESPLQKCHRRLLVMKITTKLHHEIKMILTGLLILGPDPHPSPVLGMPGRRQPGRAHCRPSPHQTSTHHKTVSPQCRTWHPWALSSPACSGAGCSQAQLPARNPGRESPKEPWGGLPEKGAWVRGPG